MAKRPAKQQRAGRPKSKGGSGAGSSARDLDEELERKLERVLDEGTKEIRAADGVFEALLGGDDTSIDLSVSAGDAKRPALGEAPVEAAPTPDDEESAVAQQLAQIVFEDGDSLVFLAVPEHGEIGTHYYGHNLGRRTALDSEFASPLRLFCSLAPEDTPLPWLIAAVDRTPDRVPLVRRRQLVERIEEPVRAEPGPVLLRVPALPSGWWGPDGMTLPGHFCGPGGSGAFVDSLVSIYGVLGFSTFSWWHPIHKLDHHLIPEVTHHSTFEGKWRRRSRAIGFTTGCQTGVEVRHRYRALGFFKWKWVTATIRVFTPDEIQATKPMGSAWLGLVKRQREIRFRRTGPTGGVRAFSRFAESFF